MAYQLSDSNTSAYVSLFRVPQVPVQMFGFNFDLVEYTGFVNYSGAYVRISFVVGDNQVRSTKMTSLELEQFIQKNSVMQYTLTGLKSLNAHTSLHVLTMNILHQRLKAVYQPERQLKLLVDFMFSDLMRLVYNEQKVQVQTKNGASRRFEFLSVAPICVASKELKIWLDDNMLSTQVEWNPSRHKIIKRKLGPLVRLVKNYPEFQVQTGGWVFRILGAY